jgi:hypothetical protein
MMHLQIRFKIQLRLQSGTCIHNRFWQSIPISNCDSALFQNEFLLSSCIASTLDMLGWNHHSTIFKLSASLSAMLHYHYTIIIHLYQMAVIFWTWGNIFHRSSLNTESHYKLPYKTKFPILFPLHIHSFPEQHLMTNQLTLHHLLHLSCTNATSYYKLILD